MTTIVKTAGMANGTPDWQLDRMFETDTERVLERQYADDFPIAIVQSEFDMARHHLGQAVVHLIRAAEQADHFGKAKPIDDLIEKLDDDFPFEMRQIVKKLKEGA